jgi:hypothetical protein
MGTFFEDLTKFWAKAVVPGAGDAEELGLSASEFARTKLGFEASAAQAAVLDSCARRGILNCSRQWGKSTVLAAKAVHRAWTRERCLVLVASGGLRQSGEFLEKAGEFVRRLEAPVRGDGRNACSLLLPNRSRIVGLPGKVRNMRGFSAVSMLLIDEAAEVSDSLYLALMPMLIRSGGDLWLMSTPQGKRGFFYDTWTHGEEWERHKATVLDCDWVDMEELEKHRRDMPASAFRQEYLGEFMDGEDSFFSRELVEGAISESEEAW